MEQTEFLFRCRPLTGQDLVPQIAAALEARTEQMSRERYPGMWRYTDHFNARRRGVAMTPKRQKWTSVVLMVLGVILLVPGLADPRHNIALLAFGGLGVAFGLGELIGSRHRPQSRFQLAARHLLSTRGLIGDDELRVVFRPESMDIQTTEGGEQVAYDRFQYVLETADTYLITYEDRVLLLLKRDLTSEEEPFRDFLQQRTVWLTVEEPSA